MPTYRYKALNQAGRRVAGQLAANNEFDLHQRLRRLELELLDAREDKGGRGLALIGQRIGTRDLVQTCLHLQQLLAAGVTLMDALADVRDSTTHRRLRDLLAEVHEDVAQGQSLSDAFGRHPRVFGTVFQSLLAAGEESGSLTESFGQLVKHLKWTEDVSSRIKKAVRYPLFTLVVMTALFMFMMMFVVPQIMGFFASNNQELPMITTTLVATSDFVQDFWWAILGAPIVLFALVRMLVKSSPDMALRLDSYLLRLPLIGPLIRKILLSRFAHFFSVLFQSGVPILTCLDTARKVVTNRWLAGALDSVRGEVADGNSLWISLKNTGEFPNLVVRMVRIGEDSGNLGETLNNVTEFYDRDVNDGIGTLVGMIEPAITLFSGIMMAWVVVAVIGPIYDSLTKLGL